MHSVRVFIDFWNFHLSVRRLSALPLVVDWKQFGLRTAQAIASLPFVQLQGTMQCEATHIYGSYLPSDKWQTSVAKTFKESHSLIPGVFPIFELRQKRPPNRTCKACGTEVPLNPEEGIDVRLAIDAVKFSSFQPESIIALVANDSDFIPLVDYLAELGRKVVHVHPASGNDALSRRCWANIELDKLNRAVFPFDPMATILIKTKSHDDSINRILDKNSIAREEIEIGSLKNLRYELYRLFADNQDYGSNFLTVEGGIEEISPRKRLSGIEDAIEIAASRLDLLDGPFLLYRGQILNKKRIYAEFNKIAN